MSARISLVGADVCASLSAHRLMTTSQLAELHMAGHTLRWAQLTMSRLEAARYVARVGVHGSRESAWYLTPKGVAATAAGMEVRRHRMTSTTAAGAGQAHTLAVNDVAIAFVRHARAAGDDCGPFSWRNETAYRLGPSRNDPTLVADAVIEYTICRPDEEVYLCRLLEIDRCTETLTSLASKLLSYGRLYEWRPGWTAHPRFPSPVVVLAGAPEAQLERRLSALAELSYRMPGVAGRAELGALATTLPELVRQGPLGARYLALCDPAAPAVMLGSRPSRV